jgi:hypothetical protein
MISNLRISIKMGPCEEGNGLSFLEKSRVFWLIKRLLAPQEELCYVAIITLKNTHTRIIVWILIPTKTKLNSVA